MGVSEARLRRAQLGSLAFSWEVPWWEQSWWEKRGFDQACLATPQDPVSWPTLSVLASAMIKWAAHGVCNADQAFPAQHSEGQAEVRPGSVDTGPSAGPPHRAFFSNTSTGGLKACIPLQRRKVLSIWLLRGDRRVCNPWGQGEGVV